MATRESRVLGFLFRITLLTQVKALDRTGLRPGRPDAYRTTYQWHLSYMKKDHPLLRITLSDINCDNPTSNVVAEGSGRLKKVAEPNEDSFTRYEPPGRILGLSRTDPYVDRRV